MQDNHALHEGCVEVVNPLRYVAQPRFYSDAAFLKCLLASYELKIGLGNLPSDIFRGCLSSQVCGQRPWTNHNTAHWPPPIVVTASSSRSL